MDCMSGLFSLYRKDGIRENISEINVLIGSRMNINIFINFRVTQTVNYIHDSRTRFAKKQGYALNSSRKDLQYRIPN